MDIDKKKKIAAVIVTFNRKDLLLKCIEGILNQTVTVDSIFLVDNASTDGTDKIVTSKFNKSSLIKYTKLNQNTGSAGGFNFGVNQAYNSGADWVWFLDDDISPSPNCLEELLKYQHISKCIHPSKTDINGREFIWEGVFDSAVGNANFIPNLSFKNGKDFTFVNIGCFEGMLIHREIIDKIGFPDSRFFIVGDDTIYGFMASLYTNVIFVKEAIINKLIPLNLRSSPTFMYYAIRNHFLTKEYLIKLGVFNPRTFYLHFFFYILFSSIKQTVRNRSIKTIFFVFRGLIHGLMGKFYQMPQ